MKQNFQGWPGQARPSLSNEWPGCGSHLMINLKPPHTRHNPPTATQKKKNTNPPQFCTPQFSTHSVSFSPWIYHARIGKLLRSSTQCLPSLVKWTCFWQADMSWRNPSDHLLPPLKTLSLPRVWNAPYLLLSKFFIARSLGLLFQVISLRNYSKLFSEGLLIFSGSDCAFLGPLFLMLEGMGQGLTLDWTS